MLDHGNIQGACTLLAFLSYLNAVSDSRLIFKEAARCDRNFWGMLGYIKQLKTTSAQKKGLKKGDSQRFYHKQLTTILNSLVESNEKLKNVAIQFEDNSIHHFDISCPVMYIISDTEGADKICGRYACHVVGNVKRHCRMCDVDSKNLDNESTIFNI